MFLIDWKYTSSKTTKESKLDHGNQRPKIKISQVLCLSCLLETLMMSRSKLNVHEDTIFPLQWNRYHQHNILLIYGTLEGGQYSLNRAKIKLVKDYMFVPVICKFDEDLFKNGRYHPDNIFTIICLTETKRQVTPKWIVQNEIAIIWTLFSKVYDALKGM